MYYEFYKDFRIVDILLAFTLTTKDILNGSVQSVDGMELDKFRGEG